MPDKGESGDDDFIEAVISYSGGHTGNFRFYFPMELARNITVNFLGIDEDEVLAEQIKDTMAETANMVIGSLLGALDPGGSATLAIPEAVELDDFCPDSLLDEPGLCLFNTEFGTLWVIGSHV